MIIEDDFTSRKLLQLLLKPYGDCDFAINGQEALTAYSRALDDHEPYDLICLDLMLPEMDGHEVLKRLRQMEINRGITGFDGVKVIITSALTDAQNIRKAFFEGQCEAYLVKPVDKEKLFENMRNLGLDV